MKVSVIGGGAWGTTLAQVLADNGCEVLIRDINQGFVNKINEHHVHPSFDVSIPSTIKATKSLEEALVYTDYIVLCVPTKVIRSVLEEINKIITTKKVFINVSKGIEPETGYLVSEVINDSIDSNKLEAYVVLSGPSHAEELIKRKLTTLVSASTNNKYAIEVQKMFANDYLRVYTSDDVRGVETGGAIKNAIAVVSGIVEGLGLGENARAALICRGMREIVKIVTSLGGKIETAYGLSGLGDLIVTASSFNSRNFKVGFKIGQGLKVEDALSTSTQTVEGIRTIMAAHEIGIKYNLELPIINASYLLITGKISLEESQNLLLTRKLKKE